MKESYVEGLATHGGPESCVAGRKASGEALTGVRAGRVLSRENHCLRSADVLGAGGRPHPAHRYRKMRSGLRAVRDPVHVRKHLAREPGDPVSFRNGWRCGTHREV